MDEDPFRFLEQGDRTLLFSRAKPERYAVDETILQEGSSRRALFVIRRGAVRIERDHLGRGVPFARLEAGQVFGEMSFLEQGEASASVVAEVTVDIDVIEGTEVQRLLDASPAFAARFYRSLAVTLSTRLRNTSVMSCPPMYWG